MPIDHSGTAPGLAGKEKAPAKLNMRCNIEGCDSINAIEIIIAGQERSHHRLYQCCKCRHTRSVAVGGGLNL